ARWVDDHSERRRVPAQGRRQFLFRECDPASLEKSRAGGGLAAVGKYSADVLSCCAGNHRRTSKIIWSGRQPSALVEVALGCQRHVQVGEMSIALGGSEAI